MLLASKILSLEQMLSLSLNFCLFLPVAEIKYLLGKTKWESCNRALMRLPALLIIICWCLWISVILRNTDFI